MSNCCPNCGQPVPEFGGIVLDDAAGTVRFDGGHVSLTVNELALFRALLNAKGRTLSKGQILDAMYGSKPSADEPVAESVNVYIHKLRRKLAVLGLEIRTHWGHGYFLESPAVSEVAA